jgi:hypothetical protein
MRISREWIGVASLALIVALLSYGPVLLADNLAPTGRIFSGFLLNPIDGHTYLAKMHQGLEGSWKFFLDYVPQPGQGVFLYQFYITLGHIAGWLGIKILDLFHLVRVALMALMFLLSFSFFSQFVPRRGARWFAFGLTLLGSGQGWLGLVFGVEGSDLIIPESVPFLAGYVNAHFPLAISLFLVSILLIFGEKYRMAWRGLGALACGAALAMVLPFSCFSLVLAVGSWLVWEGLLAMGEIGWRSWIEANQTRLMTVLGLIVGMIPFLSYDFWVVSQHPVISAWAGQNLTPSPPLLSYLFGYGLVLIMGIAALSFAVRSGYAHQRFLAAWMISGLLSLYLPISLQRRLSLGLFYPMVALAALAWDRWFQHRSWGNITAMVVLVLSLPSNLIVVGAGMTAVSSGEPLVTYDFSEPPAYSWIEDNLPADALVLSSPQVGNRLPAYTSVRVLYGHPFETPQADIQLALVESLFNYLGPPEQGLAQLQSAGVRYVFYGPLEAEMGDPSWLSLLEPVYQQSGVTIYEVSTP